MNQAAKAQARSTQGREAQLGRLARVLRSERRRLVTVAIVAAVGGGVVVAHSALPMDHMADGVGTCLAVLDAGLLATGAVLLRQRTRPAPLRHPFRLLPTVPLALFPALETPARSRAGPATLQVFRR